MNKKKIVAALALLASTQAMAQGFVLNCDLGTVAGDFRQSMTFRIDPEAKLVNGRLAQFGDSMIVYESKLDSGVTITAYIDRYNGSIRLWNGTETIATGKCSVVEKKKF